MELWDNPIGTNGFEFVEYTSPDIPALHRLFQSHGLPRGGPPPLQGGDLYTARARSISSSMPSPAVMTHASRRMHGPSACAMAFRVRNAGAAYQALLAKGTKPFTGVVGPMELNIPAIEGIGGSVIYLVDRLRASYPFMTWISVPTDAAPQTSRIRGPG